MDRKKIGLSDLKKRMISEFKNWNQLRKEAKIDESTMKRMVLYGKLSPHTKAILGMMIPVDNIRHDIYMVNNVELFDVFLQKYIDNHFGDKIKQNRYSAFQEVVDDEIRSGRAIIMMINGLEYVAVQPVKPITANRSANGSNYISLNNAIFK